MNDWFENRWAYLSLVLALALPLEPHAFSSEKPERPDLHDWSEGDLRLLLEEGRRQLDAHERLLASVRARAQWLFTTGLAVLAVLVGKAQPPEFRVPRWPDVVLSLGLAATAYAILGAAALLVVRARMAEPDIQHLASSDRPEALSELVLDHLTAKRVNGELLNTRMTVLFEVAFWSLAGAASAVVLYATMRRDRDEAPGLTRRAKDWMS